MPTFGVDGAGAMISIGVLARQTGISEHCLRKWESRYGFPDPLRTRSGQRCYRSEDIRALQVIARRLLAGDRIGKIMAEFQAHGAMVLADPSTNAPDIDTTLAALRTNRAELLPQRFAEARRERGLLAYLEDYVAPLIQAVGEQWQQGLLPVYAEHLFSAALESELGDIIRSHEPQGRAPQVLLALPAGERHGLGLCLVHALLAEAGLVCTRMRSDLPSAEIVRACAGLSYGLVGLSASRHYPPHLLARQIDALRADLPARVGLWVGGAGFDRLTQLPEGCQRFASLAELATAARLLNLPVESGVAMGRCAEHG